MSPFSYVSWDSEPFSAESTIPPNGSSAQRNEQPVVEGRFWRGVMYGLPLGLLAWAVIGLAVYGVIVFSHWNVAR